MESTIRSGSKSNGETEPLRLLELAEMGLRAIMKARGSAFDKASREMGVDHYSWVLLRLLLGADPRPMSLEELNRVSPYTSLELIREKLGLTEQLGLAEARDEQGYCLSEKGRRSLIKVLEDAEAEINRPSALSSSQVKTLAGYLRQVVEEMVATRPPPEAWFSGLMARLIPPDAGLGQVLRLIICLDCYRDDCHQAAWRPTGLTPPAVEVLTILWRGESLSAQQLAERLHYRKHTVERYFQATEELTIRGLTQGLDETVAILQKGRVLRDEVETLTYEYFNRPWAVLDDARRRELSHLLVMLQET